MPMLKLYEPDPVTETILAPRQVVITGVKIGTGDMVMLILGFLWALFLVSMIPVAMALALKFLVTLPGR